MWASASSAPRRRGRHLLLGLASPLLPCSRWPPPPSPTTRCVHSILCSPLQMFVSLFKCLAMICNYKNITCLGEQDLVGVTSRSFDPAVGEGGV